MGKLKSSLLLELLSFNSARAKIINFCSILFLFFIVPTRIVENGHSLCIFKNIFFPLIFGENCSFLGGCNCPACGMFRAFSNILHGNIKKAWQFNKLSFVALAIMVALIVINTINLIKHKRKKFK